MLAHLRRDAAALPHRGPVVVSDAQIERHRTIVATRPDTRGFGGRVSEVLKGYTTGGAEARDMVDRIKASINKDDAA